MKGTIGDIFVIIFNNNDNNSGAGRQRAFGDATQTNQLRVGILHVTMASSSVPYLILSS